MKPQFLIGSPTSGCGKTTFMLGMLRVLQRRGMKVQPFKCGPDFIDPQYHAIACNCESVNLDAWLASRTHIQSVYNHYADPADVCIIEGNRGLYDGYNRMENSSAALSRMLNVPVILVINARAIGYAIAPVLYGMKRFNASVRIVGVVFTQVASQSHEISLREACIDVGIECLGYLPVEEDIRLPQRHQGLTLSVKRSFSKLIDRIADLVEKHVDVEKLLNLCTRIFPCPYTLPYTSEVGIDMLHRPDRRLRIAVARDPAFCFLYRENVDRLAEAGRITYFSPVYGSDLPEADYVYIPGGCPELFVRQLHRRKRLMSQLREYVEAGGRLWAEGEGMTFLSRSLTVRQGGTAYEMAGILPFDCTLVDANPSNGYRFARCGNNTFKGYESHYSVLASSSDIRISATSLYGLRGTETAARLFRYKNLIAGYAHWYWGENDIFSLWN